MMTIMNALAVLGAYTLLKFGLRIYNLMTEDRSGNSGRYKRWDEEDD